MHYPLDWQPREVRNRVGVELRQRVEQRRLLNELGPHAFGRDLRQN